jgi:DNA-directed RNA polymerase subunit RPC12/RpoP
MPTEVDQFRELAILFWENKPIRCPKHVGAKMTGSFVQTTFADHVFLTCERGKETIQIPQRPKQMQFYDQQVEGYVENLQRGDAIRCYRCQSKLEIDARPQPDTGATDYLFTCIRCFSWGRWVGRPSEAKIGAAR